MFKYGKPIPQQTIFCLIHGIINYVQIITYWSCIPDIVEFTLFSLRTRTFITILAYTSVDVASDRPASWSVDLTGLQINTYWSFIVRIAIFINLVSNILLLASKKCFLTSQGLVAARMNCKYSLLLLLLKVALNTITLTLLLLSFYFISWLFMENDTSVPRTLCRYMLV
jgi:hypothetical protein